MIKVKILNTQTNEYVWLPAVKVGSFAIHRKLQRTDFQPCQWVITHIPTGRWIGAAWQLQNAKVYISFLLSLSVDWRKLYGRKSYQRCGFTRKIRNAIRNKMYIDCPPYSATAGWKSDRTVMK